ncbi:class II aldolase/adducin family protein [Oceanospirillum linum]|uniref:Class II aldolase n=1 Tax=Oceanospirillum linum TaxID=966 RepID=A0A1T1HDD1_OCELI|nr:class II aldolase/adducin family protein [Oceanospirillum linum]OOV87812.1 class II aldolase [Oceanospirillum linum]SEG11487.1 Ribulose-5-phosphate 4-epimerase/Fuculose-1-phosphate aldolase [Oleiphilus messinensis]SMP09245.1 Ribulose-5-phosphate 4-epimerase/Fuculose-1-phosphate aldolase [Oceanospirillum linum]
MSHNRYYERPSRYSEEEWNARVKLAGMYRIFAYLGWDESIYNHISLRVPGEDDHFLINPFGLHYTEVCASNLVKVDINGKIIGHSDWPINPAGFTFHGAIHQHVADGHCVMHVHTTPTLSVCCLEEGLSYSNFYSAQLYGKVAYHDFEGITVHMDEGKRILDSAGGKPVLLLKNHGPVVIGATLAQAFSLMWLVNRACEVQVSSMAMGPVIEIPAPVLEKCVADSLNFDPKYGAGEDAFAALFRLVEKQDPSFKY